jgi:cysteine-rich repeat protein
VPRFSPVFSLVLLSVLPACSGPTEPLAGARCGDGALSTEEACDDGNAVDTDGCTSACALARCGDGLVQEGVEGCDDGNTDHGDDCGNDCVAARCGDGVVQAGLEACDDGNDSDEDGCLSNCIAARCGDGNVHAGIEECDDQNLDDADACTNACADAVCGDGVLRSDLAAAEVGYEACDDENLSDFDACTNACLIARCGDGVERSDRVEGDEGFEACDDGNDDDTDACTTRCADARCGDGFLRDGIEDCDDGNGLDDDGCVAGCVIARCGDGVVRADLQPGDPGYEACDDDNRDEADGCTNSCLDALCGDGILRLDLNPGHEGYEACDDGNPSDEDACLTSCLQADCGDGFVWDGEEACDDNNAVQTDACLNDCTRASCGDGHRREDLEVGADDFEYCDDGDDDWADGCGSLCQFPVVQITAGWSFACALRAGGKVSCWGDNFYGQVGDNSETERRAPVPIVQPYRLVEGLPGFPPSREPVGITQIDAGRNHVCALTDNGGRVACWGANDVGQLGNGQTSSNELEAVWVINLANVRQVAAGTAHSCAIKNDRTVSCWGYNEFGELGFPGQHDSAFPAANVPNVLGAQVLSIHANHSCVYAAGRESYCWGANGNRQVVNRPVSVSPPNLYWMPVDSTVAGANHSCVIGQDFQDVVCRGKNIAGQVASQDFDGVGLQTVELGAGAGIPVGLALGSEHSCASTGSGRAYCWGNNMDGQLAQDGRSARRPVQQVDLGEDLVHSLAAGADFTCALTRQRQVRCWGDNSDGQLGANSNVQRSMTASSPIEIPL